MELSARHYIGESGSGLKENSSGGAWRERSLAKLKQGMACNYWVGELGPAVPLRASVPLRRANISPRSLLPCTRTMSEISVKAEKATMKFKVQK